MFSVMGIMAAASTRVCSYFPISALRTWSGLAGYQMHIPLGRNIMPSCCVELPPLRNALE